MSLRAFRGATLIDGTGQEPVHDATVLIEDGRILSAGQGGRVSVPDDAEIVDAGGRFLLPGMIDCHVHMLARAPNIQHELATPPSLALLQVVPHLRATLQAGFTTVRDAGGAPLGVKLAIEREIIEGPRLQVSITVLSQTGGHGDMFSPSCAELGVPARDVPFGVVDGVDAVRQRAREILRAGADWIKICTSGGVLSHADAPDSSQFTVAEIEAAVHEARAAGGKRCMAHALGTQGIKNAIAAGVRSIEHGIWLDDEAIDQMKKHDVFLVPTMVASVHVSQQSRVDGTVLASAGSPGAASIVDDHARSFRRAYEAGVSIAMGTDSGVCPHGANAAELVLMVEHGMSPMDAIVATTSGAARLLQLDDRLGCISAGRIADLVLVEGNPLDDISLLADPNKISLVMKDGQVFKDLARSVKNTDLLEASAV